MATRDEQGILEILEDIEAVLKDTPPPKRFWGKHKEEHIRREHARLEFLYVDLKLDVTDRDMLIAERMLAILKGQEGVEFEF
ncbi:MAG: hypothetical protein L0Z54_05180 [Thermoplasmata archaeon]|nr:hypothetical protein [Thermoplasmata archaeon]